MFNLKKHAGNNRGYRITIQYDRKVNDFRVVGSVVMEMPNGMLTLGTDGAPMVFQSLSAALDYIVKYPDPADLVEVK